MKKRKIIAVSIVAAQIVMSSGIHAQENDFGTTEPIGFENTEATSDQNESDDNLDNNVEAETTQGETPDSENKMPAETITSEVDEPSDNEINDEVVTSNNEDLGTEVNDEVDPETNLGTGTIQTESEGQEIDVNDNENNEVEAYSPKEHLDNLKRGIGKIKNDFGKLKEGIGKINEKLNNKQKSTGESKEEILNLINAKVESVLKKEIDYLKGTTELGIEDSGVQDRIDGFNLKEKEFKNTINVMAETLTVSRLKKFGEAINEIDTLNGLIAKAKFFDLNEDESEIKNVKKVINVKEKNGYGLIKISSLEEIKESVPYNFDFKLNGFNEPKLKKLKLEETDTASLDGDTLGVVGNILNGTDAYLIKGKGNLDSISFNGKEVDLINGKATTYSDGFKIEVINGKKAVKRIFDKLKQNKKERKLEKLAKIQLKKFKKVERKLAEMKDGKKIKRKDAVEYLRGLGIIKGYDDGTFKPEKGINRAEALKIIYEVIGDNGETLSKTNFSDIRGNEWFVKYVRRALQDGVVKGYSDGTFHPEKTVNKVELIKMAFNAFGIKVGEVRSTIEDVNDSDWFSKYAQTAYEYGLVDLDENGKFNPGEQMTREEFSEVIYRLLKTQE